MEAAYASGCQMGKRPSIPLRIGAGAASLTRTALPTMRSGLRVGNGGGLAAATALMARDRGQHRLAAQFLLYPMLDPRAGTPDAVVDNPTTGEFLWARENTRFGWSAMRGNGEIDPARLAHFAPALADDLTGLPPTFLALGSLYLFLEEDTAYALRLSRASVAIDLRVYPGGVHGFEIVPGELSDEYWSAFDAAAHRWLLASGSDAA